MKRAILSRFESTDYATFSKLTSESFSCFATERPWLDNQRQVSCIPAGIYEVKWHRSPKFGWCYKVQNVPNRDSILFHSGNFPHQSYGCILLASKVGYIEGKKAGILSRPAVIAFNSFFAKEPFLLEIRNDYIPYNTPIERSLRFANRLDWGIFQS